MPPVRSRNNFSSEFFSPFFKQNTSVLGFWEHLCSTYLRSQHVEKDTDDPFCCTKAVSKAFSCSKTLPLSWKKELACSVGRLESRDMSQVFWGDTLKEVCCLHVLHVTQVAWEICLCFSTGMTTVCCCWIQTLMLLSSETEWAFPAFWRGGRGCSAAGWHDEPHKHFNECCLGQWW